MDYIKCALLFCVLFLCPTQVGGGYFCWLSCMGVIGTGGIMLGVAVLPLLGFTSAGVAAGSWAAWLMSLYGGAVPAGSLFASLQATGAVGAGMSWTSFGGISGFCTALCVPFW